MNQNPPSDANNDKEFLRKVLLSVIFIPVIAWLIYFAYKKNEEAPIKTKECQQKCTQQGYPGYNFNWSVFSVSKCTCLGESSK